MAEDESSGDRPDQAKSDERKPATSSRRKWALIGLGSVFLLAGIAYAAYWFLEARYYRETADAYVRGNEVMVSPQISGTVTAILADDTQMVRRGQPLIELDRSDARLAFQDAKAMLAQTVREVRTLYEREAEVQASRVMRQTRLAQAARDYRRNVNLVKIHGVSRQEYQQSRTAWRAAKAALAQVRHRLGAVRMMIGDTGLRHHPRVALGASRLEDAYLNLKRTTILAPATGYVAQREAQLGSQVGPGTPLLAIVPLNQVWVEANFKETQLKDFRIGQKVEIVADLYGSDVTYHGRVRGLVPGTGEAFSLLPPQNATGNWIKIVQRVPVRISLRQDELEQHPLLLQLSLTATVNIRDTSGPRLAASSPNQPVYSTDIYRARTRAVQRIIERIIAISADATRAPFASIENDGG